MRWGTAWSCHRQLTDVRQEEVDRKLMEGDSFVFHHGAQSGGVCGFERQTLTTLSVLANRSRTPSPEPQTRARQMPSNLEQSLQACMTRSLVLLDTVGAPQLLRPTCLLSSRAKTGKTKIWSEKLYLSFRLSFSFLLHCTRDSWKTTAELQEVLMAMLPF